MLDFCGLAIARLCSERAIVGLGLRGRSLVVVEGRSLFCVVKWRSLVVGEGVIVVFVRGGAIAGCGMKGRSLFCGERAIVG